MSSTFEDLDVPPTLDLGLTKVDKIVSTNSRGAGHRLISLFPSYDEAVFSPTTSLLTAYKLDSTLVQSKSALAIHHTRLRRRSQGSLQRAVSATS